MINLFWEFFKIGLFTIGGGAAMIPQIQHLATVEKKWLSEDEMMECIVLGQTLPGVIAINIATYVGHKKRGITGAAMATLGVVLPSFLAIIAIVFILGAIGENRFIDGAFMGIKAAVCALILVTTIKLYRQMCEGRVYTVFVTIVSAASLAAVCIFGITAILVILAGIVIGIAYNRISRLKAVQDEEVDQK